MSLRDNPEFLELMRKIWEPLIIERLRHGGVPLPGDADDNEEEEEEEQADEEVSDEQPTGNV